MINEWLLLLIVACGFIAMVYYGEKHLEKEREKQWSEWRAYTFGGKDREKHEAKYGKD